MTEPRADVLVVGSGPAGAMVARDLARAGAKVLILERGRETTPASGLLALWRRREALLVAPGVTLLRGLRVGGGSTAFFHTAIAPPLDLFRRHGVELQSDLAAVQAELPMAPLGDDLIGPLAGRMAEAARALGLPWQRLPKMIYQERCRQGLCPPAARWSAGDLLAEAQRLGARLQTGVAVRRVLNREGRAVGVEGELDGRVRRWEAGRVIVAAGGIATPLILRNSGIGGAGRGFFCDPLRIVMGSVDGRRGADELPMSAGFVDRDAGFMLSDIAVPRNFYRAFALGSTRPDRVFAYAHTMMVMVKIRDEIAGEIRPNGAAWRHFGPLERGRMDQGVALARKILDAAGARQLFASPWLAVHPGGTVRLGDIVDQNLGCRYPNLHVCDASVIPEPWGLPPTLTLLTLARYLARILA
ncbi:FAD-dependent oxidoreductase [Acidithiobacillus sp.]|uniref:FAD-dependent oxidoreductase n=1 Tax=Acidithiobacillus sp. TaxID=1872118 RepID=UPI003D06F89D